MHEDDNRYVWMNLKKIIGSHFADYAEAWAANDLIAWVDSSHTVPDVLTRPGQ